MLVHENKLIIIILSPRHLSPNLAQQQLRSFDLAPLRRSLPAWWICAKLAVASCPEGPRCVWACSRRVRSSGGELDDPRSGLPRTSAASVWPPCSDVRGVAAGRHSMQAPCAAMIPAATSGSHNDIGKNILLLFGLQHASLR
ncbi:hypothetical protein PVAP13_7NG121900 [Panicum virgatum]|uniref:Uncharacterized protein n=1 Tax=Panicum virgatum TaxID=38727 RepID=A0A8T0PYZ8_PANVG|nr:hypothetical protein PVAP13_7NG121900 [Panicum virgatum]